MYKLKLISGNLPKKEFDLKEGSIQLGRDIKNEIVLDSVRVSRHHTKITVYLDNITIEDLQSSNGTFVNGEKISKQSLKADDKIFIGDFEFQLKETKEKTASKVSFTKEPQAYTKSQNFQQAGAELNIPKKPNPLTKALGFLNLIDWRYKVLSLIMIYVLLSYFFLSSFLIEKTSAAFFLESFKRAKIITSRLAEKNKEELRSNNDLLLDIDSTLSQKGVVEAYITDINGRVRAPISKLNTILSDSITQTSLLEGKPADNFPAPDDVGKLASNIDNLPTFSAADTIKVWDSMEGRFRIIGASKIIFSPKDAYISYVDNKALKLTGLIIVLLPAIFIFLGIYLLTIRALKKAREDIELIVQGNTSDIKFSYSFSELSKFVETVKNSIQKVKFSSTESSSLSKTPLKSFIESDFFKSQTNLISEGLAVLENTSTISYVNSSLSLMFELPKSGVIGQNIFDLLPSPEPVNTLKSLLNSAKTDPEEIHENEFTYAANNKKINIKLKSVFDDLSSSTYTLVSFKFN